MVGDKALSAIFGILNLNGRPVTREQLEAMRSSGAHGNLDASSLWLEKNVGLGQTKGQNSDQNYADLASRQSVAPDLVITAQGRLDNRPKLFSQLSIHHSERDTITNSELLSRSYVRWDTACVDYLIGDWAFALWDRRKRKLLLARDQHGISSVYYQQQAESLVFATSIKTLLKLTSLPRPNMFRLAQILTSWPGDGVQTSYEGIQRLPPAHTLIVEDGKVRKNRYWSPLDRPAIKFKSDREYVDAFLEVYAEAVRCRLKSQRSVGATLSGGLDSGSVCALAAKELRSTGTTLTVFTSVPRYDTASVVGPNRIGDETELVEANRRLIGNLDVHYVRAESVSPLKGIERYLELHDEPGHAAGNAFWIYALLHAAQNLDLGALLIGQCGNGTVSWSGGKQVSENLWPFLLSGRASMIRDKGKASGLTVRETIRRHLVAPLVRPLREAATRYHRPGRDKWIEYSAINQNFAAALGLMRRMTLAGHDPFFIPPNDPMQERLLFLLPGADIVGALLAEEGAGYDLEFRDPTRDKRLIEFCLAIPNELYCREGKQRSLIRSAMTGLLPNEVRLNRRRGMQAADLGYRLLANLVEIKETMAILNESELAREVLDLPRMNRVIEALERNVNEKTTEQCVTILTRGIMVGLFLLRF